MDRNITFRRTAQKLVKEGDVEKAIDAYEEVVSSGDADPYDFVYAGDLYVKAGLLDEAITRFGQGVSAYTRLGFSRNAIALCRRILRLDPERLDVQRELGDLFANEELLDDAFDAYFAYLERQQPDERESDIFLETLKRVEDLAPRRAAQVPRLCEFLKSIGQAEIASDLLARCTDLARSSGETDAAADFVQQAASLNPALARATGVGGSLEEKLQEVHRRKTAGSDAPEIAAGEGAGSATFGEAPGGQLLDPARGGSMTIEQAPGGPSSPNEIDLSGFQNVEFTHAVVDAPGLRVIEREADLQADPSAREAAEMEPADGRPGPDHASEESARTEPDGGESSPAEEDPASAATEAMAARDWKLARRWVDAWLLHDPTSSEAADALIHVCEAMEDEAGTLEGLMLKGDLLIQEQDLEGALPLFWRVLQLDPQNDTARRRMTRFQELGLVAADAHLGDAECAAAEPPAGEQQPDSSASRPEDPAAAEPDRGAEPAVVQPEVISPEQAIAVLTELREGGKVPVDPGERATHYDRGVTRMNAGRFEEALFDFAAAQSESGAEPDRLRQLGELRARCFSALERHREAIGELTAAMQAPGSTPEEIAGLQCLRAREYEVLGETDAARECLRDVLQAQPEHAEARRRLSELGEQAA